MKKCTCGGTLILKVGEVVGWSASVNGLACCPSASKYIDKVYCQECKTLFHYSILGDFIVTTGTPGWKPLEGEKCGEDCRHFRGEKCNIQHFSRRGQPACVWYTPWKLPPT
jgi:hypothetical protein